MTAFPGVPAAPDEHSERARLVRLCRRLTQDADAAEDLAQETLLVAHERAATLRRPERRWEWLAATARHLSVDWVRRRERERRRLLPSHEVTRSDGAEGPAGALTAAAGGPDDYDLSVELERSELALLLDRAMASLPPQTRLVLIERLVEDVPQAQVALHHGLSEGAVEARLHRGKLALRRILATDLREEAAPYGLVDPEGPDGWQTTRIWCPTCGQRRLWGRLGSLGNPGLAFELECRDCLGGAGGWPRGRNRQWDSGRHELFHGVKGFKPALNRQMDDLHRAQTWWLANGVPPWRCRRCSAYVKRGLHWSPLASTYVSIARCPQCGAISGHTGTHGIMHAHPAGRRFWREHPRVRTIPDQEVQVDGRPAIIARLVSVTENAELAMVLDAETFAVLKVGGAPTTSRAA